MYPYKHQVVVDVWKGSKLMSNYLTRAPVAIESPHPYIRHYRAPIDAGYSGGYRMSPYHQTSYGFGTTSSDVGSMLVAGLVAVGFAAWVYYEGIKK
jgi:hypothetical protein